MTAVNFHELLLSVVVSKIRGMVLVKWMWFFKPVFFALEETKNVCALIQKGFNLMPGDRNESTEMYNNFVHITSLSGRYQQESLPKCRTNIITRRSEPLVWVITFTYYSVSRVLEVLGFLSS